MKVQKVRFVQDYGKAARLLVSVGIVPDDTARYAKYLQSIVRKLPEIGEHQYSRTNLPSNYYQLKGR